MHRKKFSGPAIFAGFFVFLILLTGPGRASAATEIVRIRTGVEAGRTRVVFDLTSAEFEYSRLDESDRSLKLLVAGAAPSAGLGLEIEKTGRLEQGVISREGDSGVVVQFKLTVPSRIKSFTLDNPPRLVVDFKPLPKGTTSPVAPPKVTKPQPETVTPPAKAEVTPPSTKTAEETSTPPEVTPSGTAEEPSTPPEVTPTQSELTPEEPQKTTAQLEDIPAPEPAVAEKAAPVPDPPSTFDEIVPPAGSTREDATIDSTPGPTRGGPRVVVIDAGHGGDDPGAVGDGLREKDVCLDVARSLHRELSVREGYHPILARSQDVSIPLRQRMQLAEEAQADLFVSIHVNSAETSEAEGVEVFFLSLGGASDETARAVAERENEILGETASVEPEVEELPFSLSLRQSDTLLRSSLAAESVLDTFVKRRLAATRGVRQASFVVLKSYQVPSILVELGFASSDRDRRALKKASHRAALARALADGIDRYFEEFAPSKRSFGGR